MPPSMRRKPAAAHTGSIKPCIPGASVSAIPAAKPGIHRKPAAERSSSTKPSILGASVCAVPAPKLVDNGSKSSNGQGAETLRKGEQISDLAKRIFDRLLRECAAALEAAAPKGPQTLMDLLEDAPVREVPKPTEEHIAQARMDSLRIAYQQMHHDQPQPESFQAFSWNINGLDDSNDLLDRLAAIIETILSMRPAVVCLQEVVDPIGVLLQRGLDDRYHSFLPKPRVYGYYVALLISREQVHCVDTSQTVTFPHSGMGRQLLVVRTTLHDGSIAEFMTTHLESGPEATEERVSQFESACEFASASTADLVLLAGDLNLRDLEAESALANFDSMTDAWEHLGSDSSLRFTWDTTRNKNCGTGPGLRFRYDRAYFVNKSILPSRLQLLGMQQLAHGRYPSDHWCLAIDWPLPTNPCENHVACVPRNLKRAVEERPGRKRICRKRSVLP